MKALFCNVFYLDVANGNASRQFGAKNLRDDAGCHFCCQIQKGKA